MMKNCSLPLEVDFGTDPVFEVEFDEGFEVDFSEIHIPSDYSGSYEVTPTDEEQILPTGDKMLASDIVVKPIPQNYGLITWNGAYITVS